MGEALNDEAFKAADGEEESPPVVEKGNDLFQELLEQHNDSSRLEPTEVNQVGSLWRES